ncbi:hypothetical protein CQW23_21040 [Capsicum baccatum]|uniref:F-box associated beta-propeller type 3 domain-containing protein n=1 Tax=Capsicum baccatum TaxID=33114 RepID=A0A2G2VWV6_CAPBA|nr:hypothetical protein CQW23_21040 [Capsicum baccatum]
MAKWNPTTKEIKKIIVPSPPFYPCFSGHVAQILQKCCSQKCDAFGGLDMHPSTFLKISSNNDFRLCCSNSLEMLPHPCQILQNCATSGGSDMHPSAFLKSPSNNDFRLRCSDSPEMLRRTCQILQKYVFASGVSDTHLSSFLKSPSNNGFGLCCSNSHPCRILQKSVVAASGDSDMHPSIFLKSPRSYAHHFGFGMDPLSKDYKVVWIRDYFWKEETFTRSTSAIISVYSLSTNSWRHFEDSTFLSSHIIMSYFDSYLDGFYYWKKIDGNRRCEILAFDFRNENFQVIQTPNVFNSNIGTLGLYDGYVSMLFHRKTCIEIWVMEKFVIWTRKLVVESTLNVKRPIGYGVNGEIFVETTKGVDSNNCYLWNPVSNDKIQLPLITEYYRIKECLLSAPPHDPECLILFLIDEFDDDKMSSILEQGSLGGQTSETA